MLPFPSAVKLPATVAKPFPSNPVNRNAYCPFNLALSGLLHVVVPAPTVTVALAVLLSSATEVAVTVTVAGLGTAAGAVYFPVPSIVPQLAPVQPVPETLQVTA